MLVAPEWMANGLIAHLGSKADILRIRFGWLATAAEAPAAAAAAAAERTKAASVIRLLGLAAIFLDRIIKARIGAIFDELIDCSLAQRILIDQTDRRVDLRSLSLSQTDLGLLILTHRPEGIPLEMNIRVRAAERNTSLSALVKQFLQSLAEDEGEFKRLERLQEESYAQIERFQASNRLTREELYRRGNVR